MIEKVALWAIILLLLVVLVPVEHRARISASAPARRPRAAPRAQPLYDNQITGENPTSTAFRFDARSSAHRRHRGRSLTPRIWRPSRRRRRRRRRRW